MQSKTEIPFPSGLGISLMSSAMCGAFSTWKFCPAAFSGRTENAGWSPVSIRYSALFRLKEGNDLLYGQIHMIGIGEGVVGALDFNQLDDVVLGKLTGHFNGKHP